MSITLEHPTAIAKAPKMASAPSKPAIVNPVTNEPICYDLADEYLAHYTTVKVSPALSFSLCYENDQLGEEAGAPARVIYHWSAGNYLQGWNGYHFGIAYDPKTKKAYALRFLGNKQKGKHLWGRNGGSIGISFLCMAAGQPITKEQILLGARLGAEYCAWHKIDPRGTEMVPQKTCDYRATRIWDTGRTIKMPRVTDHATYAKADGYSRFRVDVGAHMAPVNKELLRIYDALKAGKEKFLLLDIIK